MSSPYSIGMEPKQRILIAVLAAVVCFVFFQVSVRLFSYGGYYVGGNFDLIFAGAVGLGIFVGFRSTYLLSPETFTWKAGARKFVFSTTGADFKLEKLTGLKSFCLTFMPLTYRILAEEGGKKRKIILYLSEPNIQDLVGRLEAHRGASLERVGAA